MNNNIKILTKSALWLLLGVIICFIGVSRPKALTTITSYSDINFTNSNKYLYGTLVGGVETISTGTIGTNYTGRAVGMIFYTQYTNNTNYTYTLRINFYGDDLVQEFSSNGVKIQTGDGLSMGDASIISIAKQNPNGYSTWLEIKYNPVQSGSRVSIALTPSYTYLTGSQYFGVSSLQYDYQNNNQDIINNQTNNTNNIIDNQNNNTQEIIDNANSNTQAIINAQYTCKNQTINLNNYVEYPKSLFNSASGTITSNDIFSVTEYIKIKKNENYTLTFKGYTSNNRYCLYNSDLTVISCPSYGNTSTLTINSGNAEYIRFTIRTDTSTRSTLYGGLICLKDSQAITDALKDDDIGDSTQDAADFITDFDTNTFGLTSIVTAPLNLIQSLTSSTCNDLELPLPYLDNKKLTLPCMSTIYSQHFGAFFTIYQTITYGIIAYWVIVRIFNQVKDFKNPEHDEIEVVDL